jgi:hypothetical protein
LSPVAKTGVAARSAAAQAKDAGKAGLISGSNLAMCKTVVKVWRHVGRARKKIHTVFLHMMAQDGRGCVMITT